MNRPDRSQVRPLMRENVRLAKDVRDELSAVAIRQLRALTNNYRFSIALGDLHYLESGWYVAHAGLLRLAARRHCAGIHIEQVVDACDPAACAEASSGRRAAIRPRAVVSVTNARRE